jgi:hypothetical protein
MYEESIRHAVPRPLAARDQAGHAERRDRAERRLRADLPRRGGLPPSPDMQGRSLLPVLRGRDARRLAHVDVLPLLPRPGDHNTRAHLGVRTRTHKLIYFWKKDQWELFDLARDPYELHNLYGQPGQDALTASLGPSSCG